MTRNLQSVTVSAETLAERVKTIECENWTSSKGYDRLIDRISIQEGTVHAMRIMSKEDMVSLTDRLHPLELSMKAIVSREEMVSLTDKLHALELLMMAMEQSTGQEIQD